MKNRDLQLSCIVKSNQLNNSTAKMKYSFPKSGRFEHKTNTSCSPDKFYNLPQLRSRRSASIGYSNKSDFTKNTQQVPAPNKYKLHSAFQSGKYKGITLAQGRDKIKANDIFRQNFIIPGPLDYNPQKNIHKSSYSYTIVGKGPKPNDKWVKSIPGPGAYSSFDIISNQDNIPVSNFTSSPSTRFNKFRRVTGPDVKNAFTPGPGQYNTESLISKPFSKEIGQKFPHSLRPEFIQANNVPGPGSYPYATDFC